MYFDIDVNIHMTIEDDHVIVTATSLVIFTYKNCNLKQTVKIFFFFLPFCRWQKRPEDRSWTWNRSLIQLRSRSCRCWVYFPGSATWLILPRLQGLSLQGGGQRAGRRCGLDNGPSPSTAIEQSRTWSDESRFWTFTKELINLPYSVNLTFWWFY